MPKFIKFLFIIYSIFLFENQALLAKGRLPCSGKKGGILRCENGKFLCKDGSKSASKKICSQKYLKTL